MTIPTTCLLIVAFMPYLARIPAVIGMSRLDGGYDNNHPRLQQQALTGLAQRALAAHNNSFEALLVFTAVLFIASQGDGDPERLNQLSIAYVVARIGFIIAYLADKSLLRTLLWAIGAIVALWIALL